MKSGTTTLFDALARHPRIAPAHQKEPGFFAFDEVWNKGFDWFDTLFDFEPTQHEYRLEATTDYTKVPFVNGVWERMTANPDVEVKLLYIMRHPLRRIESHARHAQLKGREIGREMSSRTDHSLDSGLSAVNLAVTQYATQIGSFSVARSLGNLHCLTLEDLQRDPNSVLAQIYEFLSLDADAEFTKLPVSNAATRLRPTRFWQKFSQIAPLMSLGKKALPKTTRDRVKNGFRSPVRLEGRFDLSAAEAGILMRLYAPEIARIREDFGIDTDRVWGF